MSALDDLALDDLALDDLALDDLARDDLARDALCFVEESYKSSMLSSAYGDGFVPLLVLDVEVLSSNLAETVSDVRQTRRSSTDAKFEVFDVLPHARFAAEECIEIPFIERRRVLEQLFANAPSHHRISLIEQRPVHSVAECRDLSSDWEHKGCEGAMIKDLDAPYRKGRSSAWMKLKRHETDDVTVSGMFEESGRHANALVA